MRGVGASRSEEAGCGTALGRGSAQLRTQQGMPRRENESMSTMVDVAFPRLVKNAARLARYALMRIQNAKLFTPGAKGGDACAVGLRLVFGSAKTGWGCSPPNRRPGAVDGA